MKNPESMGIPVRVSVRTCFGRVDHDITTGSWINRVLISTNIISSIVDAEHLSRVHAVIKNEDGTTISVGEFMFVSIVLELEKACEQMVF